MTTALEHPQVARYLRELDVALARLPAGAAAELSEQLRAHLQEALTPDASDAAITEALAALGPPAAVAAAALDAAPAGPGGSRRSLPRRALSWVGRLTWGARTSLAAFVLAVVVPASAVVYWQAQASLTDFVSFSLWYKADSAHAVQTQAGGVTQLTFPFRPGQLQGYALTVFNPSDVTQRILGSPDGSIGGGLGLAQVYVSTTGTEKQVGDPLLNYRHDWFIPPHSYRWVRVLWRSYGCNSSPGTGPYTNSLALWVRVGWITRTEVIQLPTTVALISTAATLRTAYCLAHPQLPVTGPGPAG